MEIAQIRQELANNVSKIDPIGKRLKFKLDEDFILIDGVGYTLRKTGLNPFRINADVILKKIKKKAEFEGSHSVCLSHRPMDVDNWISTAAYKEAIIFCRWLLAEELPEQPTVELGKLSE